MSTIPPVAPGFQNQQFGEVERIKPMPAPPQPMQPRPSLVVGGPAFFTPEGYQAPVQPEQAFMPTDRRTDAIGDNFRRPYERPIMPMPSPTPPPEMAQPAPPRVPIEQPIKEPVIDPGPITTQPVMPMPVPTPQPEYDPFAYSDLGSRALGGEYIDSMTFHWFDPTTGKGGSTTEGWSRVPDSAKPYTYLNKEEANEAKENFMTFEDRGDIDTTPRRTPITTPAPAPAPTVAPTVAAPAPVAPAVTAPIATPDLGEAKSQVMPDYSEIFKDLPVPPSLAKPASEPVAPPVPMKPITLPSGQTVEIPDIDMEAVNASLIEAGIIPQIPQAPAPISASAPVATEKKKSQQMLDDGADVLDVITQLQIEEGLRNEDGTPTKEASAPTSVAPQPMIPQPMMPQPIAPQAMPSIPSLPSLTLPTLPKLGSRPSLTRPRMRVNPRER